MIQFILNNQLINTEKAEGSSLLDFIRKEAKLPGTKIGCREGDCGACTVLQGELANSKLTYKSIVSCLTPLVNVQGKHIVTIEGLNLDKLSPVQKSMADNAATQCGFCTPGFVVALSGHLISDNNESAKGAISGNICRCTGYKSIEKAAHEIDKLKGELLHGSEIEMMIEKAWLPAYFSSIAERLLEIQKVEDLNYSSGIIVSGGTDLMVQQPEKLRKSLIVAKESVIPSSIKIQNNKIIIGAGIFMSNFFKNEIIISAFPVFKTFFPLIASGQIRNMGTLAGNIVNASPIGDMSILFLALNTELVLENEDGEHRILKLSKFFLDYKKIDLKNKELLKFIEFEMPDREQLFNFEKVSKRTYLDIASVNSALSIKVKDGLIEDILFSAGGVAPFPKLMNKTIDFLKEKKLEFETLSSALDILQQEISPITDIRGSEDYKRLLLRQLFLQHFLKLFPEKFKASEIYKLMTTNIIAV